MLIFNIFIVVNIKMFEYLPSLLKYLRCLLGLLREIHKGDLIPISHKQTHIRDYNITSYPRL